MYDTEQRKIIPCPFNVFISIPIVKRSSASVQESIESAALPPIPHHCCDENIPLLKDLVIYSSLLSCHWIEVALQLGIPNHKIQQIVRENPQDTNGQCYAMFASWHERANSPPCWCHFIQALYHLELNEIARKVQIHLSLPKN